MITKIRELIAQHLGIKVQKVTNDARLEEDLGADSLDCVIITMELEDEFGIEIPDEKAEGWQTVDDVILYLKGVKCEEQ